MLKDYYQSNNYKEIANYYITNQNAIVNLYELRIVKDALKQLLRQKNLEKTKNEYYNEILIEVLSKVIRNKESSINEKIDYRKLVYKNIVKSETEINDKDLKFIELALDYSPVENEKLNIPLIKKAKNYIKNKSNTNYYQLLKFINYFSLESLNDSPYENNMFSDRDLVLMEKMKCYSELKDINNAEHLINEINSLTKDKTTLFYIKYSYSKLLYKIRKIEKGDKYHKDLLLHDRKDYLLYLPIKYNDYQNKKRISGLIIELLVLGINKSKMYIHKYIYDWIKNGEPNLYETIKDMVQIDSSHKISIKDEKTYIRYILQYFLDSYPKKFKSGKIINQIKSGHGFVKDHNDSYFVHRNYMKDIKIGNKVVFFLIDGFDNKKGEVKKNAVIVRKDN